MSKKFFEKLAIFSVRFLCDELPSCRADAVYLIGETSYNQKSVLDRGVEIWKRGLVKCLAIPGSEDMGYGYPGCSVWRSEFLRHKIDSHTIISVPGDHSNTFVEAQSLIAYAKKMRWRNLIITAAPFHQPRSFISVVSAALRMYPEILLFSCPGVTLPWNERVYHSQGTLAGTRTDFITSEFERIFRYHQKGDLVSFEEVDAYLEKREQT